MALTFRFEKDFSSILGTIYRPVAQVLFFSEMKKRWYETWMIVDTGADYTLLPGYFAKRLGIRVRKDCKVFRTSGIGGAERVYFLKNIKAKLGTWERNISVGFLARDDIPPLMGRHFFLDTFETHFSKKHTVSFNE